MVNKHLHAQAPGLIPSTEGRKKMEIGQTKQTQSGTTNCGENCEK
jgi:hypothetical protein